MNRSLFAFLLLLITVGCRQEKEMSFKEQTFYSFGSKYKNEWFEAAEKYKDKILADSSDVEAYLGFAECHIINYIFGYVPRSFAIPLAKGAFEAAHAIDSTSASVLKLSGTLKFLDWDWNGVELDFKQSIAQDPTDMGARHWYSLYLAAMKRVDEALAQHDTIKMTDVDGDFLIGRGSMLYFARDFEQMKSLMIKAVNQDTTVAWGYDWLGMAYIELKEYENSLKTYYKAFELSDGTVEVGAGLGHALGQAGQIEKASEMARLYEQAAETNYLPYCQRAFIHIGAKEYDKALTLLETAYAEKSWFLIFMNIEPWYDPIRQDSRFQAILNQMNYPQ